jgi:hypothetical protein
MRRRRERGQALILVLVFVAAFLLLTWAALTLASGAFLSLNSVQADSRSTYALDAGVPYFVKWVRGVNGNVCNNIKNKSPNPLTLTYPSSTITVTFSNIAAGPGCTRANPVLDFTVSATGTARTLRAEVALPAAAWVINSEQFQ